MRLFAQIDSCLSVIRVALLAWWSSHFERGAAVQPMWQGVSIVVDEFTRVTQGEIVVHAILLANFAITRTAQWYKQQIRIP